MIHIGLSQLVNQDLILYIWSYWMEKQKKQIKVLVTPDKFRGSLNATEVCLVVGQALSQFETNSTNSIRITVQNLQLADGGEGSLQTLYKHLPCLKKVQLQAKDPLFRPIKTFYLIDETNNIAYVEMATVSGLALLSKPERNPELTTTFGVGQIILDIFTKPLQTIYLFIGGSATNDAGIGMASAIGYKFLNHLDQELQPIGKNLSSIHKIELPSKQMIQKIVRTNIYVVSDTQNVFLGNKGAAYVFAPQKGANPQQVEQLDKGLRSLNELFKTQFNINLSQQQGSGAAGGLGGGAMVFLKAKMQKGIEKIMQILHYDQKAKDCDLLITGEGKLDRQSLEGKVVYGVMRHAKKFKKKLWILCGVNQLNVELDLMPFYDNLSVISLVDSQTNQEEAIRNCKALIKSKVKVQFQKYLQNSKFL